MVKGLKTFTLDINIIKMLNDEPNQSGLINGLLANYFSKKLYKDIEVAEKKLDTPYEIEVKSEEEILKEVFS